MNYDREAIEGRHKMLIIAFALIGILLGIRSASRRGGNLKDKCLYAAVFGIVMALVGLFVTIGLTQFTNPIQP